MLAQCSHLLILRNFPEVQIASVEFIAAIIFLVINHYIAYIHFNDVYYSLSEILGYFTLCLWLVPFSLFVSLSANDQVLPTYQETSSDNDVVTNYFSSKKRKNLLNLFKNAKESLLPTRAKKAF
jgi:Transmembrane adaptor Erv26